MSELKTRVEELKMENEYQLRLKDMNYNEKIKELTEKFIQEMESLKTKNQMLKTDKDKEAAKHEEEVLIFFLLKSPKNSLKECVPVMLIRHSNYSAILSKIHSCRLLFGDFSHWDCAVTFDFPSTTTDIYAFMWNCYQGGWMMISQAIPPAG